MDNKNTNMKETFHGFQSERQETTHSLEARPKANAGKTVPQDHHSMEIQFAIYHTVRTLLLQFKLALKYSGYKCIETSDRQLLIIRSTVLDRFRTLFLCRQPPKFIIKITTHEFLSVRRVSIRPLKNNSPFSPKLDEGKLISQISCIGKLLLSLPTLNANVAISKDGESEYKQDFFTLDATSYYMFGRMLVDGHYSLGQKIFAILQKFKGEDRIQDHSKEDIQWLHLSLDEISEDLLQGFNCSRKELLEILCYCRKSVELYFHNVYNQKMANLGTLQPLDSQTYTAQIKQLSQAIPCTLKQFLLLQRSHTSMDILRSLFVVGLIFKSQCQIQKLEQQTIKHVLQLIRFCFTGLINDKFRFLKCFGYDEEEYMGYVYRFGFETDSVF